MTSHDPGPLGHEKHAWANNPPGALSSPCGEPAVGDPRLIRETGALGEPSPSPGVALLLLIRHSELLYSRAVETIANSLAIAEAGQEAGRRDRISITDFSAVLS